MPRPTLKISQLAQTQLDNFAEQFEALCAEAKLHAFHTLALLGGPWKWDSDFLCLALQAYENASSYAGNPRRLEYPWRSVFDALFAQLSRRLGTGCATHEEWNIWRHTVIFASTSDANESSHFAAADVEWRRPDLASCLYVFKSIQRTRANDRTLVTYELEAVLVSVLVELKRGISRKDCNKDGWPITEEGLENFAFSMERAMQQGCAGAELYLRTPEAVSADQDVVLVVVSVGSICSQKEYRSDPVPELDELIGMYNDAISEATTGTRVATLKKKQKSEVEKMLRRRARSIVFESNERRYGPTFAWPDIWADNGWTEACDVISEEALAGIGEYAVWFKGRYAQNQPARLFALRPKNKSRRSPAD